jgi:hypothetical protein
MVGTKNGEDEKCVEGSDIGEEIKMSYTHAR